MLFDYNKLKIHREFAFKNVDKSSFLIEHAENIIKDNIEQLNWDFAAQKEIFEIFPRRENLSSFLVENGANLNVGSLSEKCLEKLGQKQIILSEDTLPFETESFDLIISTFNMHFVNDVRAFLKSIYDILKPKGVFIANFAVDNSFAALKKRIIDFEARADMGHFQRIIPFVASEKIYLLLQEAGFKFIIVNRENIILEYNSHIDLMKDLKNMGENNPMINSGNILPKSMLKNSQEIKDEVIIATIIVRKD